MYHPLCLSKRCLPAIVLIIAFSLSINLSAAANAQSEPPAYCTTLSAEDCAIVIRARENMAQLNSVSADVTLALKVSNIPDAPFDELTVEFDQQSAIVFSDKALDVREQFKDTEMLSAMMQEDPTQFLELYMDLIRASDMETSYQLRLSDDSMKLLTEAIEADTGEAVPFELPSGFGATVRLVDGTLFGNFGELLDPLPGIVAKGDVWLGMEYVSMMDFVIPAMRAQGEVAPMAPDEAAWASQFMSMGATGNGGPLFATIAGLPFGEELVPSLNIKRVDDRSTTTAEFRTTIDYATLLAQPSVQLLLAELIRDPDFGATPMSDAEMAQAMAMVQMMGPTVLDSLGLEIVEAIDTERGLVLGAVFRLNWAIEELAPMIQMAGGPDLAELEEIPIIALTGTATYADHGADLVIEEPETALIIAMSEILELIPEEEFQALMTGSNSGATDVDFVETGSFDADRPAPASQPLVVGDSVVAANYATNALHAISDGDYESALLLLNNAVAIDPSNAAYLAERAKLYYYTDRYEEALVDYNQAIDLDSQDTSMYIGRGTVHYALSDFESGIADYSAAISIEPNLSLTYYYRAIGYEGLGEMELALADYASAIDLEAEPDNAYLYWSRALLYEELEQNRAAVADYQQYLELVSDADTREYVEAKISELQ